MKNKKNKVIQMRMTEDMLNYIDSLNLFSRSEAVRLIIEEHKLLNGMSLNSLKKYLVNKTKKTPTV